MNLTARAIKTLKKQAAAKGRDILGQKIEETSAKK